MGGRGSGIAKEAAQFGDKAIRVRDIGVQIAMSNRYFFTALTLVASVAIIAGIPRPVYLVLVASALAYFIAPVIYFLNLYYCRTIIPKDALEQAACGAMVLDVNMGVPLTDEAELLAKAVKLVQSLTDLPLCIDSSVVEALEAGLGAYEGKALVNSVTVEDDRMELILPLVKRHEAAIIALPNDETEIPIDPERRVELVKKFVDIATSKYGIPLEDIVIDPLAMPIGADSLHADRTMQAISMIRDQVGVNMTLGASNVSFGMPDRHTLNAVFIPMAMRAGLTSAIMDARTPQVVTAVKGADLMLGHDEWGASWIQQHRAKEAAAKQASEF